MPAYVPSTGFSGVTNIGEHLVISQIENNIKSFLDWGFLNIGGFVNVTRPTQNISGFNLHILKPTKDPNRANNTVWQAPRKDWVYESGISFSGTSPINLSGMEIMYYNYTHFQTIFLPSKNNSMSRPLCPGVTTETAPSQP